MAQPLYPPAGPQSIGQVLDSGFRIFQASLVSCLLYGALSMIAGQLPNIYFIATGRPLARFGGGSLLWIVLYAIGVLITLVLYAAVLYRQYGIVTGRRLGTSVELSQALRKLPAYLALAILSMIILLVATLMLVIPGLYLLTPISFSSMALLLDDKGPVGAIGYVTRLVRGEWWRTTAILTVTFVLVIVFYTVATMIVGMALPLAGATDVAAITAATGVVFVVLGSIGLPFFSAVLLATYGELKVRKEGLDLEQRVASIAQT